MPRPCRFVFHLPEFWTEATLFEVFQRFGCILSVKVAKSCKVNEDGTRHVQSKGYGFVSFAAPHEAQLAMQTMHGAHVAEKKHLSVTLKRSNSPDDSGCSVAAVGPRRSKRVLASKQSPQQQRDGASAQHQARGSKGGTAPSKPESTTSVGTVTSRVDGLATPAPQPTLDSAAPLDSGSLLLSAPLEPAKVKQGDARATPSTTGTKLPHVQSHNTIGSVPAFTSSRSVPVEVGLPEDSP